MWSSSRASGSCFTCNNNLWLNLHVTRWWRCWSVGAIFRLQGSLQHTHLPPESSWRQSWWGSLTCSGVQLRARHRQEECVVTDVKGADQNNNMSTVRGWASSGGAEQVKQHLYTLTRWPTVNCQLSNERWTLRCPAYDGCCTKLQNKSFKPKRNQSGCKTTNFWQKHTCDANVFIFISDIRTQWKCYLISWYTDVLFYRYFCIIVYNFYFVAINKEGVGKTVGKETIRPKK